MIRNVLWQLGIAFLLCYLVAGPGITGCAKTKPLSDGTRTSAFETLESEDEPWGDEELLPADEEEEEATSTLADIKPQDGVCQTISATQFNAYFAASEKSWFVRMRLGYKGTNEGLVILGDGTVLHMSSSNARKLRLPSSLLPSDVATLRQWVTAAAAQRQQVRSIKAQCEDVSAAYEAQESAVVFAVAKRRPSGCALEYAGGEAGLKLAQLADALLLRTRKCP